MSKGTSHFAKEIIRAGGIITFSSFAILIEGVGQFMLADPSRDFEDASDMELTLMISAVILVSNGFIGLFVGLGASVFDLNIRFLTLISIFLMIAVSFLAIGVFVFAQNIYNFENDIAPPIYPDDSFSRYEKQLGMIFGSILPSCGLCACTFGLQILFTHVLLLYQSDSQPFYGRWCKTVLLYFAFFIGTAAIGQLVFGSMVRDEFGGDKLNSMVIQPPNFVKYANITVCTGVLLVVYTIYLIVTIYNFCRVMVKGLELLSIFGVLWLWSAFIMTNIGLFGPGYTGSATIITALATVMIVSPAIAATEFLRYKTP